MLKRKRCSCEGNPLWRSRRSRDPGSVTVRNFCLVCMISSKSESHCMALIESVNGDSTLARTARVKSHEHNCFHVPFTLCRV